MQALQTFDFAPGLPLRIIDEDGGPWFVLLDICNALGLRTDNAARGLDDDEKANTPLEGFARGAIVVNESGLYSLVMRSRKPAARTFKKWVTSAVLPALRRDGLYIVDQEKPASVDLSLPDLLAQLAAIQEKVDAFKATKVRAWSLAQEHKDDRRAAFKAMKSASRAIKSHWAKRKATSVR